MAFRKSIRMGRRTRLGEIGDRFGIYSFLNVVLFSALAELAYISVIFFTDVLKRNANGDVFSFWVFAVNLVAFNVLCFLLMHFNIKVNSRYPFRYYGSFSMVVFFVLIGVAFYLYNYLLYVGTVASSGSDGGSPFVPTESIWFPLASVTMGELVVMCLLTLNQAARYTIRIYKESEDLRQVQVRSEIQALQTQLNPHFLFNSLNTLISEIDYDPASAKQFTINLAGVYRYILQKQNKTRVAVFEELEFLQSYINLNRVRVGESLHYECVYPDRSNLDFLQETYLPSLSLQLLAENALKHNVVSGLKPLYIRVSFTENLSHLVFTNNVNPKKNVHSLGTGLKNLSKRYNLLSGQDIEVEKTEKYFTVKLPMLNGNE